MVSAVYNALFMVLVLGLTCSGEEKIYNGEDSKPHAYPWSVLLLFPTYGSIVKFCGGALISRRYVLTIAGCDVTPGDDVALIGAHNISAQEGTESIIGIRRFIRHPEYNSSSENNNIALIQLSKAVNITKEIAPVDLLRSLKFHNKLAATEKRCTIAGWGVNRSSRGWWISSVLQSLRVKVVDDQTCVNRGNHVLEGSFCYEAADVLCSAACHGDHGTGIVTKRKGSHVLVGLHSYRMNKYDGCTTGVKGAVKIAHFYKWIDSYIS